MVKHLNAEKPPQMPAIPVISEHSVVLLDRGERK